MFGLFRRSKNKQQSRLTFDITREQDQLVFQFFRVQGEGKSALAIPLSPEVFYEMSRYEGFEQYVAYEVLVDEGYITEHNKLAIPDYYKLLEDPEYEDVLKALKLHECWPNISGELKITGTPAKEPSFELSLKLGNKNLRQIAHVEMPLVTMDGEKKLVSPKLYQLEKAILQDHYEDGYEKTAIVRQLAIEAGIGLDSFLQRENYHIVDHYQIEPQLIDEDTLHLAVVGNDEQETQHLNSMQARSSAKIGNARERFVTPKKVAEDVQKIKRSAVIKGENIPTFFENPAAFFPDLELNLNLEEFSDRVIGFVQIVRPNLTIVDGKRSWFDNESGEQLEFDEVGLKREIENKPDNKFVQHNKNWFYVDKKFKKELGLIQDEDKQEKPQFMLEIMGNEDEVTYNLANDKARVMKSYKLPGKIIATLFPHQVEGYNWLCGLYEQGISGLLADDMGLGKTIQVITLMQKLHEENKLFPSMVVLPIALIENWQNEIAKFAPELSNAIYIHKGAKREKDLHSLKAKKLIFTSYDTLKIDQLLLGQIGFECILLDEAQNMKSNSAGRSRAVRAMQAKFRLAMTGTPVENSLEELWTIMDFVEPGALGSLANFKQHYIKNENYEGLKQRLQPYYLRRTKVEVLKDQLPAKHILEPTYVQASPIQSQLAATMMSAVQAKQTNLLNVISDLRVLYAHPDALRGVEKTGEIPPKFAEVLTVLRNVRDKDEKVLIFTEFKKIQQLLKQHISKEFQISVPIINGETDNRSDVVRKFNESQGFGVMLLSPRAAGVGLTITSANHVIHYTRWWNPAVENQATDRTYRIGQTKDVYVYHIITQDPANFASGSVEEIMHQILSDKSHLAENVIVPFDLSGIQEQVKNAMFS